MLELAFYLLLPGCSEIFSGVNTVLVCRCLFRPEFLTFPFKGDYSWLTESCDLWNVDRDCWIPTSDWGDTTTDSCWGLTSERRALYYPFAPHHEITERWSSLETSQWWWFEPLRSTTGLQIVGDFRNKFILWSTI